MKNVKYSITETRNGHTVRILVRGRLVMTPQEFTNRIDCLNYVNTYCLLNNAHATLIK